MRDHRHLDIPDTSHMIPIRISVAKVKAMSDAELLAALNGEDGRKGMMTMQFLQLITSELLARNIERSGKPHWSTVPSFWLLVISVALSLFAILVAVFSLPQMQQHIFPNLRQDQALAPDQGTTVGLPPVSKSSKPAKAVP